MTMNFDIFTCISLSYCERSKHCTQLSGLHIYEIYDSMLTHSILSFGKNGNDKK